MSRRAKAPAADDVDAPSDSVGLGTSTPASPLYFVEIHLLRLIQKAAPLLTPVALFVHYFVSQEVVSPVLGTLVWLTSLPDGATIIACISVSQCINTIIKWSFQRPRPQWFRPSDGTIKNIEGAWQADFSFPSSHGQFFAGFMLCSAFVFDFSTVWMTAAVLIVVLAGVTRNYLGLHWVSDTVVGGLLGSCIGVLWGTVNPYLSLMAAGRMSTSVGVATVLIGCLVVALNLARAFVPPVHDIVVAKWHANAVSALPHEARTAISEGDSKAKQKYVFKARTFESIAPELTTAWCALAYTGFYPQHVPTDALHRCYAQQPAIAIYVLRVLLGLAGLVAWTLPLLAVRKAFAKGDLAKTAFKVILFAGLCTWVFWLSHIAMDRVGLTCGQH